MKDKHALILGASGLIGSELLQLLIQNDSFSKITLLVRKELTLNSKKVKQNIVDFSNSNSWGQFFKDVDTVFCCIGTTRAKTPDLKDYRKIDFDIPVYAIRFSEQHDVKQFMLVSSIGANPESKNFYLKIKGEVESKLFKSSIAIQGIFQPSLLLGNRKEKRFGEGIARILMPLLNFLIPMKYKAIQSKQVAQAMINASKNQKEQCKIYVFKDMVVKD